MLWQALELASLATVSANYEDWWWKERLGKCYYMLGLYRDAEKQFASSLKSQPMILTHLQLAKVQAHLTALHHTKPMHSHAFSHSRGPSHTGSSQRRGAISVSAHLANEGMLDSQGPA